MVFNFHFSRHLVDFSHCIEFKWWFALCNIRTKSCWTHIWNTQTGGKKNGSHFWIFYFIFLQCLWPKLERVELLYQTWVSLLIQDSEVMVFFFFLVMPFLCDCIKTEGPVCDSITVCNCKCSNVQSVVLGVMFVLIFSGNSALPLQLFVAGEVFPLVWEICAHVF